MQQGTHDSNRIIALSGIQSSSSLRYSESRKDMTERRSSSILPNASQWLLTVGTLERSQKRLATKRA